MGTASGQCSCYVLCLLVSSTVNIPALHQTPVLLAGYQTAFVIGINLARHKLHSHCNVAAYLCYSCPRPLLSLPCLQILPPRICADDDEDDSIQRQAPSREAHVHLLQTAFTWPPGSRWSAISWCPCCCLLLNVHGWYSCMTPGLHLLHSRPASACCKLVPLS